MTSINLKKNKLLDDAALKGKSLDDLKAGMVVARFVVVKALSDFKQERLAWQKQRDDHTQNQVYLLTKVIKKEVFDLSDTMDVMAKVIRS